MKKPVLLFTLLLSVTLAAQNKVKVYFDFDIDEATSVSGMSLETWMAENKDAEVLNIHGYADTVGNAYYNIDLSERRAQFVLEQLAENNMAVAEGAEVKGFGESSSSSGSRAMDRRVELTYRKKEVPVAEAEREPVQGDLSKMVANAKKGDKLRLPNLYFYNNSPIVLPSSQPVLKELLTILQQNPLLKIDIQGHICCQITESNQVSHKRAKAIYEFLVRNNIDKTRLTYQSFGSSRPIHKLPEQNEKQREDNRRVEIQIIEN
ncbi:MAG: OmpA family protein [Flavobacterium sp.]|nr:MAG: OmpA family protein [Flavobacterium sp.]